MALKSQRLRIDGVIQPDTANITTSGVSISRSGKNLQVNGSGIAVAGNDLRIFELASDAHIGDVNVFSTTPAFTGFAKPNLTWVIDPWLANAEKIFVNQILNGTTLHCGYFDQGLTPITLRMPHTAGARIICLDAFETNPLLYGAAGDGIADDWMALQRAFNSKTGETVVGSGVGPGHQYKIKQPLIIYQENRWREIDFLIDTDYDDRCVQNNIPIDPGSYGVDTGLQPGVMCVEWMGQFSVTNPGSGVIHLPYARNGYGGDAQFEQPAGQQVIFNNPHNEPLPGGLVSGRCYRVLSYVTTSGTWPTGDVDITIAEWATPNTLITFSSPGNGMAYTSVGSNTHEASDYMRITIRKPNVDGFRLPNSNQPSRARDTQITMEAASGGETGFQWNGQLGHFINTKIDMKGAGAKTGTQIGGVGLIHDKIAITNSDWTAGGAGNPAAIGVKHKGQGNYLGALHVEGIGLGLDILSAAGFRVDIGSYKAISGGIGFMRHAGDLGQSNFELGPVQCSDLNVPLCVLFGTPTVFTSDGSPNSGVGDTDAHGVFPGLLIRDSQVTFTNRAVIPWKASTASVFKMRRIHKAVIWTSDAAGEVWLPNCAGQYGIEVWVQKTTSSNALAFKNSVGTLISGLPWSGGSSVTAAGLYRFVWINDSGLTWVGY